MRENDLFNCCVNVFNHVGTHKCSAYCLKEKYVSQKFDPTLHGDVSENDKFTSDSGDVMVKSTIKECRMRFGRALKFDSSGENNITRGIPPRRISGIEIPL